MALRLHKNAKFLQILRSIRQTRNGHYDAHGHVSRSQLALETKAHYDCLPKAQGKWSDLNAKRNQSNNTVLAVGTLIFLSALIGCKNVWDDIYWTAPYDKIRKDFPGAKFVD